MPPTVPTADPADSTPVPDPRSADRLRVHSERLLLPAAFVTCLGNGIQLTASALLLLEAERSTLGVGWVFVMVAIPQVLLSPYFGRLADRFDRRMLCLACDVLSALAAVALPAALLLGSPAPLATYAANFLLACITALFMPASNALVKERVRAERLAVFSGHYEMAVSAGNLLSTAVGGFLIQMVGVEPLLFFNAFTFLASAGCWALIGGRPEKRDITQPTAAPPPGPAAHVRGIPAFRLSLLYAISSVIVVVSNTLIVVLVVKSLRLGPGVLGVVDSLAGIGMLLGGLLYRQMTKRVSNLTAAVMGYLACAIVITLEPRFGVYSLALFLLGGLTFAVARISTRTLLMSTVAEERAGRVFGSANALGLGLSVIATLVVSHVADLSSVSHSFLALALLTALPAVVTAASLHGRSVHSLRHDGVSAKAPAQEGRSHSGAGG
ncbi:MFS transporter [Streptomyces sp. NBC_01217]|uniref:MFS transporter n=1 Tax=Streptomyces sp. NBC_01217 TaxID=2903779 RepID=UPI002E0F78A4|nr:MFS transporter [Streptomyces sp. NBC_01217]